MAIFSSLLSFFNRNKRKILLTSAFSLSVYLLIDQFVIKKFRNFQKSLREELIFKQQIKQRFIQTQQDCYYTILALLPVLTTPVVDHLPVELITQALRLKKTSNDHAATTAAATNNTELTSDNLNLLDNNNDPESHLAQYVGMSKIELWNLLKIKTITRTLTLLYSTSGLLLITRLQLNILARRSYLESAILMAGAKPPSASLGGLSHENYIIEQSYLSLSWWLLNKGWLSIANAIEPLVVARFQKINPKSELSVGQLHHILLSIADELESKDLLTNLFPHHYDDLIETLMNTNPDAANQLDNPDSNFVKLINETKSIISTGENAPYFHLLFRGLVETGLTTLANQLVYSMNQGSDSLLLLASSGNLNDEDKITEINLELENKPFKLALYLAQLSVQNSILADNNNIEATNNDDEQLENFIHNLNNAGEFLENKNADLSGNVYINSLNGLEALEDFSAGVYSNYE